MPEPVVWNIEEDHWPRASLRAELIERGLDAVGFESVSDAFAGTIADLVECKARAGS